MLLTEVLKDPFWDYPVQYFLTAALKDRKKCLSCLMLQKTVTDNTVRY